MTLICQLAAYVIIYQRYSNYKKKEIHFSFKKEILFFLPFLIICAILTPVKFNMLYGEPRATHGARGNQVKILSDPVTVNGKGNISRLCFIAIVCGLLKRRGWEGEAQPVIYDTLALRKTYVSRTAEDISVSQETCRTVSETSFRGKRMLSTIGLMVCRLFIGAFFVPEWIIKLRIRSFVCA